MKINYILTLILFFVFQKGIAQDFSIVGNNGSFESDICGQNGLSISIINPLDRTFVWEQRIKISSGNWSEWEANKIPSSTLNPYLKIFIVENNQDNTTYQFRVKLKDSNPEQISNILEKFLPGKNGGNLTYSIELPCQTGVDTITLTASNYLGQIARWETRVTSWDPGTSSFVTSPWGYFSTKNTPTIKYGMPVIGPSNTFYSTTYDFRVVAKNGECYGTSNEISASASTQLYTTLNYYSLTANKTLKQVSGDNYSYTMCDGDSIVLTGSQKIGLPSYYKWSSGEETKSITVKKSGSYNFVATWVRPGCERYASDKTVQVIVLSNPKPTISPSNPGCWNGSSIFLTSSDAKSYYWSNGASTKMITVNSPGEYYVETFQANGCLNRSNTVTISPKPVGSSSDQTICPGQITNVQLNSTISGTSFSWIVKSSTNVTGASSGNGTVIKQVLTNTNNSSGGSVVYTVTPSINSCTGNPFDVTVTLSRPSGSATGQSICSGQTSNVVLKSTDTNATFSWIVKSVINVTGASAGSGSLISQALINTTTSPGSVTYTVTPSANGCIGNEFDVSVNVSPVSSVVVSEKTICSGQSTSMPLTSNVGGATFSWTVVSSSGVTGASAGSGTTINNTLNTNFSGTVVYRITASISACPGPSKDVTVTVNNCSNEALVFDGSNDYVNIPEKNGRLNLGTGPFTMEVFMKSNSTGALVTLLSKRTYVNGVWSSFLFGVWNNGKPFIQLSNTPNILPLTSSINLFDGNCHHVAVRKSGTTISFFVDGNFISNGDNQSNRNINSSGPMRIGNDTQSPTVLNGWIGEVRVWNIALTDAQILNNMNVKLAPQTGLMALYDMKDDNGSQTLTDLSTTVVATQNNGTLGSSSTTDVSDPAWLAGNLVTCNAGSNFRIVTLTSENSYSTDSLRKEFINTEEPISLFPNPANKSVTIQLLKEVQSSVPLKMFDAFGREVYSVNFQRGEKTKVLNTEEMAAGVYVIQVEVYGILFKKKIMVVHR